MKIVQALIIVLGFLQFIGWTIDSNAVSRVGFWTNSASLTRVFSGYKGIESFSSQYVLQLQDVNYQTSKIPITPETYTQLSGPYSLRNAYKAAIAISPVLRTGHEKRMVSSIIRFGLCNNGPIAKDFLLKQPLRKITIEQNSRAMGISNQWITEVKCR